MSDLPIVPTDRYVIGGEVARGGLGRIVAARDAQFGRPVALKELIRSGGDASERFIREAAITARLQHPGIVPIYEAGRWPTGEPFYAMKMVSGRSLKDVIAEKTTLAERLALLPNVIAVADAIAYAHSQRVIHRDLKPSNVLVGDFGETVVVDWGLAKDLAEPDDQPSLQGGPFRTADDPALTATGAVMGTPAYMPPEQARGEAVDERADVYALGAILYHALSGAPPYRGSAAAQILTEVLHHPPAPLGGAVAGLPPDLATIVAKAMAPMAKERYRTANEFAEDLRRFQTGQLVSSHRYSPGAILRRWVRRHRGAVTAGVAMLGVLVATGLISVRRIIRERNVATQARHAEANRANELLLVQASTQLSEDPTSAISWLKQYPRSGADWAQVRDIAADAMSRGAARHVLQGHTMLVNAVTFGADGGTLYSTANDSTLRIWHLDGTPSRVLAKAVDHSKVASSRDGTLVAYDEGNGNVAVMRVSTNETVRLPGHDGVLVALKFSPNGRWLLTRDMTSSMRLWDLSSSAPRARTEWKDAVDAVFASSGDRIYVTSTVGEAERSSLIVHQLNEGTATPVVDVDAVVVMLAVDRLGRVLAYSTEDGRIGSVDLETRLVHALGQHGAMARVAITPDGEFVASGSRDGTVSMWSAATGKERAKYHHGGPVTSVTFAGRVLATGSEDGSVILTDVDLSARWRLRAGASVLVPIAVSPDGHSLAVASQNDLRTFSLTPPRPHIFAAHEVAAFEALFVDENQFVTDGTDGRVILWQPRTGEHRVLGAHEGLAFGLAVSRDRSRIASAGHDGTVMIWDLVRASSILLRGHQGPVRGVALSPLEDTIATAGADRTVRVWDLHGKELHVLRGFLDDVYRVAFSTDGRLLAGLSHDGSVRVWRTADWTPTVFAPRAGIIYSMAFVPGSNQLVIGAESGEVFLWSPLDDRSRVLHRHDAAATAIASSRDGRWAASASADGALVVYDLNGSDGIVLRPVNTWVRQISFAPDSMMLAGTCQDGTVRLWDLATGDSTVLRIGQTSAAHSSFSPDGAHLATAFGDGTIAYWTIDRTQFVPAQPRKLLRYLERSTQIQSLSMSRL